MVCLKNICINTLHKGDNDDNNNKTQTLNEPSKRIKNIRNVKFWKIRMQKQISSWRKELSIIAETGTGSDNGKLNRKKEDFSKI